jgi:hypothetical protein
MVCYARPVSMLTGIVLVIFLVFGKPTAHFFDGAGLVVAVTIAMAAVAVAAAMVFAAAMSTRRRRAAEGACVTCRFRCQHAMTGPPGRLWLVSTADRGQAGPVKTVKTVRAVGTVSGRAAAAAHPGPRTLLPIQPVAPRIVRDKKDLELVPAGAAPQWPDRPIYRADGCPQRAT